jgi:hypothetical protein
MAKLHHAEIAIKPRECEGAQKVLVGRANRTFAVFLLHELVHGDQEVETGRVHHRAALQVQEERGVTAAGIKALVELGKEHLQHFDLGADNIVGDTDLDLSKAGILDQVHLGLHVDRVLGRYVHDQCFLRTTKMQIL